VTEGEIKTRTLEIISITAKKPCLVLLEGRHWQIEIYALNSPTSVHMSEVTFDLTLAPSAPLTFLFGTGDTAVAGALARIFTLHVTVLVLWVHLLLFD